MSTYIDILRAHQQGKLKGNEPSKQDPTPAWPASPADASAANPLPEEPANPTSRDGAAAETADAPSAAPRGSGGALPDSGAGESASPRDMLQEEAGTASLAADADDASEAESALPEEPAHKRLAESPETMLQEEAAASLPASDAIDADLPDQILPEEAGSPPLDIAVDDDAEIDSLLQEEGKGRPLDFGEDDDAIFARMLQDEPPAPPKGLRQQDADQHESVALLSDELPEVPSQSTEVAANDAIHTWLSGCVMLLVRLYEDAAHDTPTDISPLSRHLDRFSTKIYEDPEELGALELDIANRIESIRQAHADCGDLVQKAVMMMLYGFKVCVQMRMEPTEITRYVTAAILHNIGMAQIFVDTRQKEGKLTNAERTLIRQVSEKSVDYLKRCGISDRVILLAAQQAQERHDGSGPHGLTGADIALSARIVGLLSMFEALVHVRSYRERLLPRDAIRELINGQKNRFDPAILKNLIESVSLYPVGTYVQLNSGDIGQVIRIQPRLPLRPKIVLTMDRHGNRIQAREVDLQKQPNLMVQRCMYREGLVPMKAEEGEK